MVSVVMLYALLAISPANTRYSVLLRSSLYFSATVCLSSPMESSGKGSSLIFTLGRFPPDEIIREKRYQRVGMMGPCFGRDHYIIIIEIGKIFQNFFRMIFQFSRGLILFRRKYSNEAVAKSEGSVLPLPWPVQQLYKVVFSSNHGFMEIYLPVH